MAKHLPVTPEFKRLKLDHTKHYVKIAILDMPDDEGPKVVTWYRIEVYTLKSRGYLADDPIYRVSVYEVSEKVWRDALKLAYNFILKHPYPIIDYGA